MSYSISSYNFTDTEGSAKTITLNCAVPTDFRKDSLTTKRSAKDSGVTEAYLNNTSGFGVEERVRIRRTDKENIYSTSGIDRAFWAPTLRGVQVNFNLKQIWTASTSGDLPDYRVPVTASLTLTLPADPAIADTDITALLDRLLAVVYASGADHLGPAFRGSLSW